MSNIIKSDFVLYNTEPIVISVESPEEKEQKPANAQQNGADERAKTEQTQQQKALDDAEKILRSAVKEADDIVKRGRIEAKLALFKAIEEGKRKGYQDGLEKGRIDGELRASQNVSAAAKQVIEKISALDADYINNMAEVKADCVDFAFGLAENILGIQIDRGSEDYQRLVGKFLCIKSCKAAIEVDGCKYPFETLRTEGLVPSADGLQGILVYHDDPPAEKEIEGEPDEPSPKIENMDAPQQIELEPKEGGEDASNTAGAGQEEEAQAHGIENGLQEPMPEDGREDEEKTEVQSNYDDDSRGKFVFVRPSKRPVALATGGELDFSKLAQLDGNTLKAVLRKIELKDIVAALSGADEGTRSAFTGALTRRTKEKVLDAMKYLGPVKQQEIDAAREKITKVASETIKNLERGAGDV